MVSFWLRFSLAGIFLWGFLCKLQAQDVRDSLPDPAKGYHWTSEAKKAGLSAADIDRLAKDKVLIGSETFKQVFSAYIGQPWPLFITSDSLLNAYHVLFEESIRRLERANARKLPLFLRHLAKNLEKVEVPGLIKGPELSAARRRAQLIVGTALVLLGEPYKPADDKISALAQEEAVRVVAAKGWFKPAWLGPPNREFWALDYTRFQPRGFYTGSEDLQRYFRAYHWLQAIPFRIDRDEELLAAMLLEKSLQRDQFRKTLSELVQLETALESFYECFPNFIGPGDDWDIRDLSPARWPIFEAEEGNNPLVNLRKGLLKMAQDQKSKGQINDQLRFPPVNPQKPEPPTIRIFPSYQTPDAVLFQRTAGLPSQGREFPSGLEIGVALGSHFGRTALPEKDRARVLAQIDKSKELFKGDTCYLRYFDCLAALLDKPETGAPAFLAGKAWQAKSCQTLLAGWAQLRHTWSLQAKETLMAMGITRAFPGFVEPVPEFYSRLGMLARMTPALLEDFDALGPDYRDLAQDIRAFLKSPERDRLLRRDSDFFEKLPDDKKLFYGRVLQTAAFLGIDWEEEKVDLEKVVAALKKLADDLEKGGLLGDPYQQAVLKKCDPDLQSLWRRLEMLCLRLEALANKQLRQAPLNKTDVFYLQHYGEELAGIMLYGGNSYLMPRDDAPRIVDVFANPNTKKFLEVGIARPQALYVLYPIKGGEILCRGAILPYYEFGHPQRLTDSAWKNLLDSPQHPLPPAWIKPLLSADRPRLPKTDREH